MKYQPARLDPVIYNEWLKESPKRILGGDVLELTCCKGYGEEDDAWNLDARQVSSGILNSKDPGLYIMGVHGKYEGFKIYVNIKDELLSTDKFLLMGHQHHPGPYEENGINIGDHPHFHQITYSKRRYSGKREPRKTHERHPSLFNGMNSEQFLYAFLRHYYFDHSEDGKIQKNIEKQFQSDFSKFDETSRGAK